MTPFLDHPLFFNLHKVEVAIERQIELKFEEIRFFPVTILGTKQVFLREAQPGRSRQRETQLQGR